MRLKQFLLVTTLALSATSAMAGPIYTFNVSEGTQPANVGVITLTQNGAISVNVSVDLLPATASSTPAVRTRLSPSTFPEAERRASALRRP